ncbi:unnamed protein product [Protopolystoma xenopodis]|uniref:Uncharacterized protein n=1 Tax=Protopolystoma xenopodis TaxID=117903 RepID=A0A448WGK8_9PLAT|nr:unnamed protein product [Protopolystoma xenopodis]
MPQSLDFPDSGPPAKKGLGSSSVLPPTSTPPGTINMAYISSGGFIHETSKSDKETDSHATFRVSKFGGAVNLPAGNRGDPTGPTLNKVDSSSREVGGFFSQIYIDKE